jgi:hypothetical protein
MESMASLDWRDAKKAQKIGHTSNTAILSHAKNLRGVRTGGSWRPGPLQTLLVTGILAFPGRSLSLDRVDAQPEVILQSAPPKASLIAGLVSTVDRKRSTDSGAARKQPRAFKKDIEVPPDNIRNAQRQRAISPPRQWYEQRGLSSFLAGIGHALGFSRN